MSAPGLGRVPPHDVALERALLGCVLLEHHVFSVAKSLVSIEDFYTQANALAWETFLDLASRGEPIDQITMRAALVRGEKLALFGGDEYLLSLTDTLPTAAHAETYARRVRELAQVRRCITACHELAAMGYSVDSFESYRAEIEKRTRALTTAEVDGEPVHIGDVLAATVREIEDTKRRGKGSVVGHTTGLRKLDEAIGGWQRQRLYVIAGRPGMGKSALTSATIERTAPSGPGLFFSIEMPANEVGLRLLVSGSGIDMADAKAAQLGRDHWLDLARTSQDLASRPIYLDTATRTLDQITAKSRRFKAKHGELGWIIVDYLQLMQGDRSLPREQQVSSFSRELKALSKELDVPVIALSQLNRACEERPDKRPQMSDLRESGAIEQDADAIVFVYRRGYYAAQMKSTKSTKRGRWDAESEIAPGDDDGVTELLIAKNRGGAPGIVKCLFQGPHARFVDLDDGRTGSAPDEYERHNAHHWSDDDA